MKLDPTCIHGKEAYKGCHGTGPRSKWSFNYDLAQNFGCAKAPKNNPHKKKLKRLLNKWS